MLKQKKRNNIILLEVGNSLSMLIAKQYRNVYDYSGNYSTANKLPNDMLEQTEFYASHYLAGLEIDWVYAQYVKQNEIKFLNKIFGDERTHFTIKKNILLALGGIFYSSILAEKFIKQYKIKEPIDFIPSPFSHSLYRIISKKKDLFPENVFIPEFYLKAMKYREGVKNSIFRFKLIFYPLWLLLNMDIKWVLSEPIKRYRYGIQIWNSWISSVSPPYRMSLLEVEDCVNPKNALYIMDGDVTKSNVLKLKRNGYDSCYFREMIQRYPALKYFKEKFICHIKLTAKCFSTCKSDRSLLSESYLRAMQGYIVWDIFYSLYYVEVFITLQDPGTIQRVIIQKKHGAKCLFVFWSTSYDFVYRKDMNTHFDSYYSFMIHDVMMSSLASIEYFKKNNNFIDRYISIGVLRSDIIFHIKHDLERKKAMKERFGMPLEKIIIGFFDTTVGKRGMLTNVDGFELLDIVYRLLESNKDYYVLFRSIGNYYRSEDIEVRKAFIRLIEHQRILYLNKLEIPYYAFEVMGVCDFVIGAFAGSAPLESVSGGIRTLCYVPEKLNKDIFTINKLPYFCVSGYKQLKEYTEYWLKSPETEFLKFQDTYIKKTVDPFCDGRTQARLVENLNMMSKN